MNQIAQMVATQEATKEKYRGKGSVEPRSVPRYPMSVEREYRRIMRQYSAALNAALRKHLPAIYSSMRQSVRNDCRFDDASDYEVRKKIESELIAVSNELNLFHDGFELDRRLEKISEMAQRIGNDEWRRIVKNTLGVEIRRDYYNGAFYSDLIRGWVSENASKIKTLPQQEISKMQEILYNNYLSGKSLRDIAKEVQKEFNATKRYAELLARDQLSTLNAQITRRQHEDAGVTKYKWSTSMDVRVRDCHKVLEGKIFRYDDPPEMWYMTKSRGIVYTGRRCNPGEDYACRCVAIPVFDFDATNLPLNIAEST